MGNLTIKQKLFGISALVVVLTAIAMLTAWHSSREIDRALTEDRARSHHLQLLDDFRDATIGMHLAAMDSIVDMGRLKGVATREHIQQLQDNNKKMLSVYSVLQKLAVSGEERQIEKEIGPDVQHLARLAADMLAAINARDTNAANGLDDPIDSTVEKIREILGKYMKLVTAKQAASAENVRAAVNRSNLVNGSAAIVIILVVAVAMLLLGRGIIVPLARATQAADAIATGNLRVEIPAGGKDEIGQLLDALRHMRDGLAAITGQIRDTSSAIGSSLAQVRAMLTAQAAAAAEQAASVTEATATLAQISATSKQTMERTVFLGEIAEKARSESDRGQSAVGDAVQGMNSVREKVEAVSVSILDLSKKNQQIGGITDAVDDLARQSKMLALNASIEAARAGEAGHGFAVVAKEISNLAEQSRESTAQVRAILLDIQSSSERAVLATEEGARQTAIGNRQVQDAGKVIGSLGEVVQQTATASQQITAAVRQEAAGIEQIVTALREIAAAATNAAASTRQAEDAMTNLAKITDELQERVRVYRQ